MKLVSYAQEFVAQRINNGSIALDLTCGNGKDSLFLARIVGRQGKLYSIDIQKDAIQRTKKILSNEDCLVQSRLILSCHSKFTQKIPFELKGEISAVMFNLGYLPKGDHQLTTKSETTIAAIVNAYDWLSLRGVMTLIAYRGHPGGTQENIAVKNLISANKWNCKTEYGNQKNESPILYMISKN